MATKKNPRELSSHFLNPGVPKQSTFFSPPFRAFCLFYMQCLKFLAVFSGKAKEKCVYSICPDLEVLQFVFKNTDFCLEPI